MEIWDLYDKNKMLTGKTHVRGEDIPKDHYHLVVHIWIRNKDGKYLITKRSENKKHQPGLYECVCGSVLAGESSIDGAVREVTEEVGLQFDKSKGKLIMTQVDDYIDGVKFSDILDVWIFDYNGEVDISKATTDEVSWAGWCSIEEMKEMYDDGRLIPFLRYFFDIHKKLQKEEKKKKILAKNKKKSQKEREKSKYFDYYDDIKHGSHKIIDW